MNRNTKSELAYFGESLASEYLSKTGFRILERNYHSAYGEIDIIALDKEELVFIEVKTRTRHSLQAAENSINLSKQKKITRTAQNFIFKFQQYSGLECRFDAMIIFYFKNDDTYKIMHIPNAFQPVFDLDYV